MRASHSQTERTRLQTCTIGLPSVFHTAPPQPASNARITCGPEFVGGAEASQKGLGLLIPAKSIDRSGMFRGADRVLRRRALQERVDRARSVLTLGGRVD